MKKETDYQEDLNYLLENSEEYPEELVQLEPSRVTKVDDIKQFINLKSINKECFYVKSTNKFYKETKGEGWMEFENIPEMNKDELPNLTTEDYTNTMKHHEASQNEAIKQSKVTNVIQDKELDAVKQRIRALEDQIISLLNTTSELVNNYNNLKAWANKMYNYLEATNNLLKDQMKTTDKLDTRIQVLEGTNQ